MGYGLKRLLEIEEERKKRREEKARIKAEKEKLKKEEKKKARAKKMKKLNNQRYYAKRKKAIDEYRAKTGDESGTFSIYLMRDGRRQKFFGMRKYKNAALQLYYETLQENNSKVKFKQTHTITHNRLIPHTHELILVKKVDLTKEENVSMIRNEDGKFIEHYFVDAPTHKIMKKDEWLVEETFNVYGFDHQKDRKTFDFILNDIVLKRPDRYSRLMVYKNRVIFHYDEDFDMITCKSVDQAIELYNKIEESIDKKKCPTILFMGKISGGMSTWIINEIEKKSGWTRKKCKQL